MFDLIHRFLERFRHVKENSWHWTITHEFFTKKAYGGVCSYYVFKVPCAVILAVLIFCVGSFVVLCRSVIVGFMWFIGYSYRGKIQDIGDPVTHLYKYLPHKLKKNGEKMLFSPVEYVLSAFALYGLYYVVFVDRSMGFTVLTAAATVLFIFALIYFAYVLWHAPFVVRARSDLHRSFKSLCVDIIVESDAGTDGTDEIAEPW